MEADKVISYIQSDVEEENAKDDIGETQLEKAKENVTTSQPLKVDADKEESSDQTPQCSFEGTIPTESLSSDTGPGVICIESDESQGNNESKGNVTTSVAVRSRSSVEDRQTDNTTAAKLKATKNVQISQDVREKMSAIVQLGFQRAVQGATNRSEDTEGITKEDRATCHKDSGSSSSNADAKPTKEAEVIVISDSCGADRNTKRSCNLDKSEDIVIEDHEQQPFQDKTEKVLESDKEDLSSETKVSRRAKEDKHDDSLVSYLTGASSSIDANAKPTREGEVIIIQDICGADRNTKRLCNLDKSEDVVIEKEMPQPNSKELIKDKQQPYHDKPEKAVETDKEDLSSNATVWQRANEDEGDDPLVSYLAGAFSSSNANAQPTRKGEVIVSPDSCGADGNTKQSCNLDKSEDVVIEKEMSQPNSKEPIVDEQQPYHDKPEKVVQTDKDDLPSEAETWQRANEDQGDDSLVSYLTGRILGKESNIISVTSNNSVPSKDDDSLVSYLTGGIPAKDSTIISVASNNSIPSKSLKSKNVDNDDGPKDHLNATKEAHQDSFRNDVEMDDSKRLVIDVDKGIQNTGNQEETQEEPIDWLEDSQSLVIEEVNDTILGDGKESNAQEKKKGSEPTSSGDHEESIDDNDDAEEARKVDKDGGTVAVTPAEGTPRESDSVESSRTSTTRQPDVTGIAAGNTENLSQVSENAVSQHEDTGCSNSELTQMLLQLIAPSVYRVMPGKRQIKGSILNCKPEASYQVWQSLFNINADIFHCTVSGCKAKLSYTKLIVHLLLEHNMDFSVTKRSAESRRDSSMYCCADCSFKTAKSIIYLEHVRYHFIKKPYLCTVCSSDEGNEYNDTELAVHFKTKHSAILPKDRSISLHYNSGIHTFLWKHRFICPVCTSANAFYYFPLYLCHLAQHTYFDVDKDKLRSQNFQYDPKLATYNCSGCSYNTKIADAFFEHVRIHLTEGKAVYKCMECNRIFKTLLNFRVHQSTVHPNMFPDVEIMPDSQPQIDETYHMMHMFQIAPDTGSKQQVIIAENIGKTLVDKSGASTKVLDHQQHIDQSSDQKDTSASTSSSTKDKSNMAPLENKAQDAVEDLVTLSHCKAHNFLTSNYIQYILHLRKEHGNFTNVNFMASQGKNNTIAFKDGYYICTGCLIKTEIREMFQEHMRCHTLTFPYQCTGCRKDFRDVFTPHSPCWDRGESFVDFLIKPSPTMEDVMKKLGPLAPATSKSADMPILPKEGPPSSKQLESASQVILLDDDSSDDIEIIDNPTSRAGQTTPGRESKSSDTTRTMEARTRSRTILHNFTVQSDHIGPNATSTPVHSHTLAVSNSQTSSTSAIVLLGAPVTAEATTPARPLMVLPPPPPYPVRKSFMARTASDTSVGKLQSMDITSRLTGMTSSGIVSLNPSTPESSATTATTKQKQQPSSVSVLNILAQNQAILGSDPSGVVSLNESLDTSDSSKSSKCYSYVYADGYFHCGACDYQISATQEDSFRYHVYVDVHVRGSFKQPCAKCGKSGHTPDPRPSCPLVDDVMVKLQHQKSSHSLCSNIVSSDKLFTISNTRGITGDTSSEAQPIVTQSLSYTVPATQHTADAMPDVSSATSAPVQTILPSSSNPFNEAAAADTGIQQAVPTSEGGSQWLCGVVNGTLVPLGSVVNGEIVQRTTDQVLLAPSGVVPETSQSTVESADASVTSQAQGQYQDLVSQVIPSTSLNVGMQGVTGNNDDSKLAATAANKTVKPDEALSLALISSDSAKSAGIAVATELVGSYPHEKERSENSVSDAALTERMLQPKKGENISQASAESSKDAAQDSSSANDVTSVTQSVKGPIMTSETGIDSPSVNRKENSAPVSFIKEQKTANEKNVEQMDVDKEKTYQEERQGNVVTDNSIKEQDEKNEGDFSEDRKEMGHNNDDQTSPPIVKEGSTNRGTTGTNKGKEENSMKRLNEENTERESPDDVLELSDDSEMAEGCSRLVKQKTVLSCDIINGTYKCLTCGYSSTNGQAFKQHMWKHIHKKSMACEHVDGRQPDKMKKCPIIIALVQLLIVKSKQKVKPQERVVFTKRFADSPPPPPTRKKRSKGGSGDKHNQEVVIEPEKESIERQSENSKQTMIGVSAVEAGIEVNTAASKSNGSNAAFTKAQDEHLEVKEKRQRLSSDGFEDENLEVYCRSTVHTGPIGPDVTVQKQSDIKGKENITVQPENRSVEKEADDLTQQKDGDSGDDADVEEEEEDVVDDFEMEKEDDEEEEVTFHKIHGKEAILCCPVTECKFSNDDTSMFTQHLETKHSHISRFRCGCCKNPTQLDANSLVLHLQRQEREDHKYGCVLCGFLTSTVEVFESHLQENHTDDQEFHCSYCETPFSNIAGLMAHLHVNVAKMYKCPYCDKSAPTRKNVLLHLPRGHPGQQRRAVESTVVYCENKDRPGHSILGNRSTSFQVRQRVISGDRKSDTPSRAEGYRAEQSAAGSNKRFSTSPLIPSSSSGTNIDRQGTHRQDSSLEGSASNMECTYCKFTAFSKAQLEHHEMWHEEPDAISGKAFKCTMCPCTVEEFANFKFHLQFHPGDHKLKYYKCGECNSYKSNVEDRIEAHHKAQHADQRDSSSDSDDDEATYMVAKLKVGFHNGKIMCPTENCTEAYENVVELQEHSVQRHGSPLSDGHRHDFYIVDKTSQSTTGSGHLIVNRSPGQGNADSNGIDRMNRMNIGRENQQDNTNKGSGGTYGKKRADNGGIDTDDQPMDEDNVVAIGDGVNGRDKGEIAAENVGIMNDMNECELPDMVRDSAIGQEQFNDFDALSPQALVINTDDAEVGSSDIYGDDGNYSRNVMDLNGRDSAEMCSPAPIVVVPDDYADNEHSHLGQALAVVGVDDQNDGDGGHHLEEETMTDTTLGEESMNQDDKEAVFSMQQSDSGDFVMPLDPSWKKCTYCVYATRHKKSYVKHIETHEKFQTFTGNAFKCAYCAFMSQAKAPAMRHIRNFHPGKASKMYYVRLVVGKTMSEMEMMAEFGMSKSHGGGSGGKPKVKASPGSSPDLGHAHRQKKKKPQDSARRLYDTDGGRREAGEQDQQYLFDFEASLPQQIVFDTAVHCPRCAFKSNMREEFIQHLRTHLYSNSPMAEDTDDDIDSGLGTMELDPKHVKQEGGSSIPSHQDPDWFMELTKEEAAFCNKVSGLGLFQCKLCMHMDQDSTVVRTHYVKTHPDELPILCGYCRERCDSDSFRKHHQDCHAMHPVKMIKLTLAAQSGKKFLDVHAGELEMEEVIHVDGRMNDWTEAMRPFVSAETSGTYRCNFCNYAQYGTSALKRHVFPIHFKQYPYECMYCQIGMTQVNQMKSHIMKMHPSLPIRIRKPLPPDPSDDDIQKVVDITSPRRTGSPSRSLNSAGRCFSPSSTNRGLSPAATLRVGSPRNTRTPKSESTSRDLLSPFQIKQEVNDTDTMEDSLSQSEQPFSEAGGYSNSGDGIKSVACRNFKKIFKCHYCKHTSKWTARDVQRHILTTHLGLKLFNCCYCDFGCYSRNRLETHVYLEHPGKQFRVANLDKRMNSVQVVQDTEDGVEILALFKPDGDPVYHLDPTKRDVLRKYTLSGRYFNTTTRASPTKKGSPSPVDSKTQGAETDDSELSFPIFADEDDEEEGASAGDKDKSNISLWPKKLSGGSRLEGRLTPEQMGQMMRKSIPKNIRSLASVWRCKMCGLMLLRNDRIKYHIICHHWKKRPYKCPYCDVMKYQKEPVHQHIQEAHPGSALASVSICEEKVDELNSLMERVENTEPNACDEKILRGIMKKPGPPRSNRGSQEVKDGVGGVSSEEGGGEGQTEEDEESNESKEAGNGENAYECVKCANFVGDMTSIKDHVIRVHLRHRLYLCDFCDSTRNDISTMVEHMQKMHPEMPQRFSHAYGKFKEEVDAVMRPVMCGGGSYGDGNTGEVLGEVSSQPDSGYSSIKCPACQDVCKNQADFDWHLAEEHPQYVKYQCGYCQVVSDSKRELKNHLVDHHSDKQPDYTFIRNLPPSFRAIMVAKQSAKKPSQPPLATKMCKLCHFSCDSLAILNNHMESNHLNQSLFQCRLCSGLHKTKDDLLVHYGVLHQNDPLQYKVVPLGAEEDDMEEDDSQSDQGDMSHDNARTKLTNMEQELKCEFCLYEGVSPSDLKQHTKDNHRETQQAIMDGIENQSESILKNALAGKHKTGSKQVVLRYECKHCNYQTRECVTIRRHVMTHINYKPYSCPLCNTNSIRSNTVKSHLRLFHKNNTLKPRYMKNTKMESMIHQSIDKIYASPEEKSAALAGGSWGDLSGGGGSFKSPASIKRNGRNSSGAGEYVKEYSTVHSNQSASSSVAGDDGDETESEGGQIKYSCKLCGYSYHGTSQNIRRHVMVHFNYRKFRCPYCDFTAVQSNNVTQHIQGIHENQPIKYLTVRDEDMERRLDDAIVKFGSDSSPQAIQHRKKIEKVSSNQGKGLNFKGDEYHSDGRKSQLGVNKPRKLQPDQIIPPRPGQCLYYKCKICNFTENSSSRKCTNIRRHVMSHLNYKRYVCPYCPFGATTTCMTKAHTARKHEGKKTYWLDKKDPVMEKLMRANIIKVGGKPWTTYNYEDGGTPFKQKPKEGASRGATGGVGGGNDTSPGGRSGSMKSPMAPIQKLSLSTTERMKVTAELAEEDRGFGNYQCKFCKKRLANSSAIKRHVAAHFYYRRYGCPYCELLFTQSTFAVNHVRAKHKGMAVYYMDNKDPKMEAKIRRSWVNISAEEESEVFNAAGIVRGAGKRKIKKPQKAIQLEQDILMKAIKCEQEAGLLLSNEEAGQESMDVNMFGEEIQAELQEDEVDRFEMNHLGNVRIDEEDTTANEMTEQDSGAVTKQKAFKCCQCSYETEHKTSMIRHVMWKIGYKPYQCGLCSFTDVLYIGLKKHAVRKHKYEPFNPIITKNSQKEAEVEDIMTRSTVYLPKGARLGGNNASLLEETDIGGQTLSDGDDLLESLPLLPDPITTVKIEPGLEGFEFEYLYDNHHSPKSRGEARFPKPRGDHAGHKTSDEPIPEDVVRRSVNKAKCEICGKMSSSKGYIYNHVIRHGPPKLRCEHCMVCFYFPKEAKTHNERKHPDLQLKVKRLWGTSKWDKKTAGIEPADPVSKDGAFPDKLIAMDTEDSVSFEDENSLLEDDDNDGEFGESESLGGGEESNGMIRVVGGASLMDMPVFPQPEATMVERSLDMGLLLGVTSAENCAENNTTTGQVVKNVEFEESILERTPVRIPIKDPRTGVYQCAFCSYSSKNPTHIKCHVLIHQPPHWRCDHCRKTFIMLYKLRKHSSTVHKGRLLMYTNLITDENCIGSKINYERAVFPNRESKATTDKEGKTLTPALEESHDNNSSNGSDSDSSESDVADNELAYEEFDAVSVSSNAADYVGIRLRCPKCDFTSVSEQVVLMHMYLHQSNPEFNRDGCGLRRHQEADNNEMEGRLVPEGGMTPLFRCALCTYTTEAAEELSAHRLNHSMEKPYKCGHCDYTAHLQTPVMLHCIKEHPEKTVSLETKDLNVQLDINTKDGSTTTIDFNPKSSAFHFHPSIELRNFLDLPIELLHAFMVQNGLSEIHQ